MENVAREPNGRVSRSGIDYGPADVVAIDARMRHTGLSREKARDQKAETFIGYLNLIGPRDGLSDSQYSAAINFLNLRTAYWRSIKAPGVALDGENTGTPSDVISPEYEDWVADVKEVYGNCRRAIQDSQNENRGSNLWAALDLCVVEDQRLFHMIGDVRIVCNALAKFFQT